MNLQILASVMNKNMEDVITDLNIKTDAIIINQTNYNAYEEKYDNNSLVKFYSFAEHGVGISRNNALLRASGDICIIADDDVRYNDNYKAIIIDAYNEYPNADMIIFNVPSLNIMRRGYCIQKNKRVHFYNCLRYGTYQFTFKSESIIKNNIFFSLLFGGGTKYGSGEDSLFILECIKKGLNVYCNKNVIGTVKQSKSTWFKGYNEKYVFDKGALIACGFPGILKYVVLIYMMYKLHKQTKLDYREIWKLLLNGCSDFLK